MEYTGKEGERTSPPKVLLSPSPEGQSKPHKIHSGWSMIAAAGADGYALDLAKSPQKQQLEPIELPNKPCDKLRCCFDHFHGVLLKGICAHDALRPLPPILGDGQCADLFKLFLAVREKGGCNAVSRNGLWGSVAEESGLGLRFAAAVKLVYIKYLDTFERWLDRVVVGKESELCFGSISSDVGQYLMELQAEFKGFLSEISDRKAAAAAVAANDYPHLELSCDLFFDEVKKSEKKRVVDSDDHDDDDIMILNPAVVNEEKLSRKRKRRKSVENDGKSGFGNGDGVENDDEEGEKKCCLVIDLDGGKSSDDSSDEESMALDPEETTEETRESLRGMLNWVKTIAKDPGDPVFGSMPEPSKWKSHGNREIWKQVLLARDAVFTKRNIDSGSEQSNWQKTQRMHPSMYGDQLGSCYNLRERLKCRKKLADGKLESQGQASSDSSSATSDLERSQRPVMSGSEDQIDKLGTSESSMEDSFIDKYSPSRIPTGPAFQAEVPEWTGETSESDSKWLGSRVWPLDQSEHRFLVERDPIGKGRQGSCGCEGPGSVECVRFHIAEKRLRVKRELGSAFYLWRFNKMGEEVTIFWAEAEEKKFKDIVSSNPPSLEKSFWDQIFKDFPTKSRADLVNYYYNVFLLRRRAHQNRFSPGNIDSDDEESEPGLVAKGFGHETLESKKSILLTPNKQHKK